MHAYLRLLGQRRFRLLWLGATTSFLGDGISFVALIWIVSGGGGSATHLSWFVAAYTAPVILGGPLIGMALDRFDRRTLMIADNLLRAGLVALLPLLSYAGSLRQWNLYAFAVAYGLLKMIPLAGVPALIPELVEPEQLETANALETTSFYLSLIAGPALAGVLVTQIGAVSTFWLDAASYLAFAFALAQIGPMRTILTADQAGQRSIRDALRFVTSVPILLATTVMFMLVNIGEGAVQVLSPVYVRQVLHAGSATYGALLATAAAAGLLGALLAGSNARRFALGRAIALSEVAAGTAYSLLAAKPQLLLTFTTLAAGAFFLGPLTVWAQTIRMRLIPATMRGRVFGTMRTIMQATPPVGALIAAPLLSLSVQATAAAIGAVLIMPALAALLAGALGAPSEVGG